MKIGIFGGSFNPPHKMHKKIAKVLIKKGYVDKVIFVPTGMKYEYKTNACYVCNDVCVHLDLPSKEQTSFHLSCLVLFHLP